MIFGKKTESPSSSTSSSSSSLQSKNTRILSILAQDYLKEKRSRRRWGIFFKFIILTYVGIAAVAYFTSSSGVIPDKHTALVEIDGVIGPDDNSAHVINQSLAKAFASKGSVGVVLEINSPGGTPVQSSQINEEIQRLRSLHPEKPFYVAITDVCASGGYYIAVAAEEIYAHPASIVGSIGVLMNGFGFVEAMNKLGVERRLITAGENKSILDPFSPVDESQMLHAKEMLDNVHVQFIDAVKRGRGDRLQNNPEIFSGLFWSGEKALELGLIDNFGSSEQIARDVIGVEKLVDYTFRPTVFSNFAKQFGASIVNTFFQQLLRVQ